MQKYIRINALNNKSACPICGRANNHLTGDCCQHCVKLTIKGIVFYKNEKDDKYEKGKNIL